MVVVVVVVVIVVVMVIEELCLDVVWPEQCYGWPQLVARGGGERDGGEEGVVGCLNPHMTLTHPLNSPIRMRRRSAAFSPRRH